MRTHRLTATIASLLLLCTPALATAAPADVNYPRAVAPTTGPTPSDYATAKSSRSIHDTKSDLGVKAAAPSGVGDTKSDLGVRAAAPSGVGDTKSDLGVRAAAPSGVGDTKSDLGVRAAAPSGVGDTKVDAPGASRAPAFEPPAVEIVRPERTIVRDVNEELPVILAGLALLVALAGTGLALLRTRRIALSR